MSLCSSARSFAVRFFSRLVEVVVGFSLKFSVVGSAGVSLVTYRQVIGLFQAQIATRLGPRRIHGSPSAMSYCSSCRRRASTGLLVFILLFFVLRAGRLTTHGDVERYPGPRELRVAVLNARSILNKLGEFEHSAEWISSASRCDCCH